MTSERIWVGIDAGADLVSLCAIDQLGQVLSECTLVASAAAVSEHLKALKADGTPVLGIEAGSTAVHLSRGLREAGYDIYVLETRHVSGFLHVRQNKTDRNDARGIADVVRLGLGVVPKVLVKSVQCQRLRSELVLRTQLMQQRVAIENAIRAVLRLNGAKIGRTFSGAHLEKNVGCELGRLREGGNDLTELLTPALNIAVALRRTLEKGSRRLDRIAREDDVCRLLMTVPGVGTICALSFYTAIEDPSRFKSNDDVGPYFGLVPKISQSGQTLRRGRISKMGSTMTRTHLVTAAKSLMQQPKQDCALRRWAMDLAGRSGRHKARTALARKIATVMLAIWKSGQSFKPETSQVRSSSSVQP